MYSLGAYELQERKRKAEQDRLKKTTSKNWKPAKRNRFLTNIYGKGLMVSPPHPSQGETHTYKTLYSFPRRRACSASRRCPSRAAPT